MLAVNCAKGGCAGHEEHAEKCGDRVTSCFVACFPPRGVKSENRESLVSKRSLSGNRHTPETLLVGTRSANRSAQTERWRMRNPRAGNPGPQAWQASSGHLGRNFKTCCSRWRVMEG